MTAGDATLKNWTQVLVAVAYFLRVPLFQFFAGVALVAFTSVEQAVLQLIGGGFLGMGLFALADIAVPLLAPYPLGLRIKTARLGDSGRYSVFERPYISIVIFERGGSEFTYASRSRPFSVGGHLRIILLHRLTHLVVVACVLVFAFLCFGFGRSSFVAADYSIRWVSVVVGVGVLFVWHSIKLFFNKWELDVIWFSLATERQIRRRINFQKFKELCELAEQKNWSGYAELFERVVMPLQPTPSWPLVVNQESNLPGLYAIALVHCCQIDKLYHFIKSSAGIYGSVARSPEIFFLNVVFTQTAEMVKPTMTNGNLGSFSDEALQYLDVRKRALALAPDFEYELEYLMSFEYVPTSRPQTVDKMLDMLNHPGVSHEKFQLCEAAARLLAAREAGSVVRDFRRALALIQPYLENERISLPDGIRQTYIHYATFLLGSLGEHRRGIDLVMREISSASYTLLNVDLEYNLMHLLISTGDLDRARYHYSRCSVIIENEYREFSAARLAVAGGDVISQPELLAAVLAGSQGASMADSARLIQTVSLIRLGKLDEARTVFAEVVDVNSLRFEARPFAEELQRIQIKIDEISESVPHESEYLDRIERRFAELPTPAPATPLIGEKKNRRFSYLWALIASGVLFFFSFADVGWLAAASLIPILLLHELGHIIAMRTFGAKDTRILFLPFLGAVALGDIRSVTLTPAQKIVIALAGPVPGLILAGVLMLTIGRYSDSPIVFSTIFQLLILNGVNLFPIYPLDGGVVVSHLLFDRFPIFAAAFIALSFLGLAAVSAAFGPIGGTIIVGVMLIETIYATQTVLTKRHLMRALRSESATKEDFITRAHRWIAEHAPRRMDTATRTRLCEEVAQILAAPALGFRKRLMFSAAYVGSVLLFFALMGLQLYIAMARDRPLDPFVAQYLRGDERLTEIPTPVVAPANPEEIAVSSLEQEFVVAVSKGDKEKAEEALANIKKALEEGQSGTAPSFEMALAILTRDYSRQEQSWGEESE